MFFTLWKVFCNSSNSLISWQISEMGNFSKLFDISSTLIDSVILYILNTLWKYIKKFVLILCYREISRHWVWQIVWMISHFHTSKKNKVPGKWSDKYLYDHVGVKFFVRNPNLICLRVRRLGVRGLLLAIGHVPELFRWGHLKIFV